MNCIAAIRWILLVIIGAGLTVVAACGDSDDGGTGPVDGSDRDAVTDYWPLLLNTVGNYDVEVQSYDLGEIPVWDDLDDIPPLELEMDVLYNSLDEEFPYPASTPLMTARVVVSLETECYLEGGEEDGDSYLLGLSDDWVEGPDQYETSRPEFLAQAEACLGVRDGILVAERSGGNSFEYLSGPVEVGRSWVWGGSGGIAYAPFGVWTATATITARGSRAIRGTSYPDCVEVFTVVESSPLAVQDEQGNTIYIRSHAYGLNVFAAGSGIVYSRTITYDHNPVLQGGNQIHDHQAWLTELAAVAPAGVPWADCAEYRARSD